MKTDLYQIYYSPETKAKLHPGCIGIDNSKRFNPYPTLESRTICDLFAANDFACDYLGVLSWKFEMKVPISISNLRLRIEQDEYKHDVYTFFSALTHPNIWQKGEVWHNGIIMMAEEMFKRVGFHFNLRTIPRTPVVYQNAHVTKLSVYKDFVYNWLRPCVNVLETHQDLQDELNKRMPYRVGNTNHNTEAQLMRSIGKPYYTMHAFIAERIFSTYLAFHPQKIKNLC